MQQAPTSDSVPAEATAAPLLSSEERSDIAGLATELPVLQHQLQELDLLLQQNSMELESQRLRSDNAEKALQQLEQGGGFSREQYQQLVTQAHQSQLRYMSVQHQVELQQSKRETVQQVVDVAQFALVLAARLDPSSVELSSIARPALPTEPAAPVGAPSTAEPLPPPSETAIIEAQEEERSWIARQMHNGPAQALTNLILRAEICERMIGSDTEAVRSELHDLRQTIQRTLQDMRRVHLRCPPDDPGRPRVCCRRCVASWTTGTRKASARPSR